MKLWRTNYLEDSMIRRGRDLMRPNWCINIEWPGKNESDARNLRRIDRHYVNTQNNLSRLRMYRGLTKQLALFACRRHICSMEETLSVYERTETGSLNLQ